MYCTMYWSRENNKHSMRLRKEKKKAMYLDCINFIRDMSVYLQNPKKTMKKKLTQT